MSSITTDLAGLSGTLALLLIAALVFGETAVFLGFVIPGETAAVLGGVLASRGRVSLPLLIIVVVVAAVTGPLIGYEIGRHLGGRVIAARRMRRVAGGMDRAQAVVHRRGGLAVLLGRFVAILRALMPAVAGTTRMPYRTFLIYNMLGGLIWGIGYCLLGYVAGSAYAAIERTVGTGVAIVVAVAVLGGVGFWLVRRHRREQAGPGGGWPRMRLRPGCGWPGRGWPGRGWPGRGWPGRGWPGCGWPGRGLARMRLARMRSAPLARNAPADPG